MAQDALANGFVQLCIDPSKNFFDGKCRAIFIGQALEPGDGSDPLYGQVQQVSSKGDIVAMFGAGSVLSAALQVAFCTCPDNVAFYAVPLEDPTTGGVAAVYKSVITGPAMSAGRFTLYLGNAAGDTDYSIDVEVDTGDDVATIAAAVVAAVSDDFPYTATVSMNTADPPVADGVLWTAKNKGVVGNHLNPVYNWAGRRNYAPGGVTVVTTRTVAGAGAPAAIDLITLFDQCCYSCITYLGEDTAMQKAVSDYLDDAWSCEKPQCFGEGFTYNAGTLGEVLATGNNSRLQRVAYALDSFDLPYLTVANYAALTCCTACDDPELSIQGPDNGLLACVAVPQSCGSPWTFTERQQLQDNGFVTYGPTGQGSGELTNPQIYNDVTNKLRDELGRLNATSRDASSVRLQQSTAIAIAEQLNTYNGLSLYTKQTRIQQGKRGTNVRLMQADMITWAKGRVGDLFGEFDDPSSQIVIQTDGEVKPPCQGQPEVLHCKFDYTQPVRIGQIVTTLQPRLLDNCKR
jgi:phage tail sheath gpL-like